MAHLLLPPLHATAFHPPIPLWPFQDLILIPAVVVVAAKTCLTSLWFVFGLFCQPSAKCQKGYSSIMVLEVFNFDTADIYMCHHLIFIYIVENMTKTIVPHSAHVSRRTDLLSFKYTSSKYKNSFIGNPIISNVSGNNE